MSSSPRVSILLPVRNGMPYLPVAVQSLLTQTFDDFELIAIDDGSADGTPAFLSTIDDPRVRVVSPGGVGLAAALNTGLALARGRFIARQDATIGPRRIASRARLRSSTPTRTSTCWPPARRS